MPPKGCLWAYLSHVHLLPFVLEVQPCLSWFVNAVHLQLALESRLLALMLHFSVQLRGMGRLICILSQSELSSENAVVMPKTCTCISFMVTGHKKDFWSIFCNRLGRILESFCASFCWSLANWHDIYFQVLYLSLNLENEDRDKRNPIVAWQTSFSLSSNDESNDKHNICF